MSLLQIIPSENTLNNILAPILGDKNAGTGVAGVLKLLESIDTTALSTSLTGELDQSINTNIHVDSQTFTGSATVQLEQARGAFPSDPSTLLEPLTTQLEQIKNLSTSTLSTQLLSGLDGLGNIGELVPSNSQDLISGLAERLTALKGEFISGEFGELRAWSESINTLYTEIEPLVTGGGSAVDKLLDYLREKVTDLTSTLLPNGDVALGLVNQFDTAITLDSLNAIDTIKTELINAMNSARADFDAGNFSNATHHASAQTSFEQLTNTLANIVTKLRPVLEQDLVTPAGLTNILQKQFDDFAAIEIVDLGNIKDKFTAAIERIQKTIEDLDLNVVRETIDEVFTKINGVTDQFDLSQLTSQLSDLQTQLNPLLESLDGTLLSIVASVRNLFEQIKQALQSVASTLGSYDEEGNFNFNLQKDLETFLGSIKTTLQDTLQPQLASFKTTVGGTLQQVQQGLNSVKGEIEGVKTQLQGALQGVNDELERVNITTALEGIRQKLDNMLNELGVIDFDPIVDPVVTQIDEMGNSLKKIDVSALSEITVGALKVSVEVVVKVDFTVQITDALMAEFDKLLQIPKDALNEIETKVESNLQSFTKLEPSALLSPLNSVFEPVTTHLDALKLDTLLEPLNAWHESVTKELDKVSPANILSPLIDLHTQLGGALDGVSPAALTSPIQEAIDGVKSEIQNLDISGLANELSASINKVKTQLEKISPDKLLTPLIKAFDKIMIAFDNFNPAKLLEPFTKIFDALAEPLADLTSDHAQIITEIFNALRKVIKAFDPRYIFQTTREKTSSVNGLVQQLNVGGLIASIKGPYDAMNASFEANGGPVNVSLNASVEGLNPLRNSTMGQVITDLQGFQTRLNTLATAEPPTELTKRYDEIKTSLESLIPSWAQDNISADSIRRAFQVANPLDISTEINQIYDAIKNQLKSFDPRVIQENLKETFDGALSNILALDPANMLAEVQNVINGITQKFDVFDLNLITSELNGLTEEINGVITGLDPRPIIDKLQALVSEVTGLVEALKPSEILADLNAPFETAKSIVEEFNPSALAEPLLEVFEKIQKILLDIDIGVVLEPLAERLEKLRDELEAGLRRTEEAFNGMLKAIPV